MLKRILKENKGKLPVIKEMPDSGKNFINDRIQIKEALELITGFDSIPEKKG